VFAGVMAAAGRVARRATRPAASDNLRQCLANAGVALVTSQGLGLSDDRTLAEFPQHRRAREPEPQPHGQTDRHRPRRPGLLRRAGPGHATKVGLITYDWPAFRRAVEQDMLPELERRGLDVADPVFVKFPERASDAGEISAQLSNTVLRFRSEGVTHVMIFELNALLTVLFMTNADTQGYRPRYGMDTQNGGQVIVGSVPEAQLEGAQQVGWLPMFDVLDTPEWPAQQECLALYTGRPASSSTAATPRGPHWSPATCTGCCGTASRTPPAP
jgi:hypothetical protein